jgi:hypothetical protein
MLRQIIEIGQADAGFAEGRRCLPRLVDALTGVPPSVVPLPMLDLEPSVVQGVGAF